MMKMLEEIKSNIPEEVSEEGKGILCQIADNLHESISKRERQHQEEILRVVKLNQPQDSSQSLINREELIKEVQELNKLI